MSGSPCFYMTTGCRTQTHFHVLLTDRTVTTTKSESSSRLRVLHFGRFHRASLHSGIERHVGVLLRELTKAIEVDDLVANDCWRDEVFTAPGGYRVIRVASLGLLASTALAPGLIVKARALHRVRPYDLFHFHFPDPLSHLASLWLPRGIPRVVTWHSDIVKQRFALPLYAPLLRRFVREVDAIIVSSPQMLQASPWIAQADPERCVVIPFGLDYSRFDADACRRRAVQLREQLCGSQPLVLSVGRLVYYKGFEYLIVAVAGVPSVQLVIIGRGPLQGRLQSLAERLGCASRVHLLRVDDDDELAAWYHACDVFCLPSVEPAETFGQVQLEAMACGKPVVSTRLGTGVEFVNQDGVTGLTVPPRDVQGLRAALVRLLDDPTLRADMGSAARTRALSEFSAEVMARRTLALYQEVLRRRATGSTGG